MSQSLREGGGAISKFYIRRAYKLCPAIWQSRAAVAREAHNLKVAGSSPASATMIVICSLLLFFRKHSRDEGAFLLQN